MKAFSHRCTNIDISLYSNTLTLYIKIDEKILNGKISDFFDAQELSESQKVPHSSRLRYVTRDSSDHPLYHQDTLDREITHYHLQYSEAINQDAWLIITSSLKNLDIISDIEMMGLKTAYTEANEIEPPLALKLPPPPPPTKVIPQDRHPQLEFAGILSDDEDEDEDEDELTTIATTVSRDTASSLAACIRFFPPPSRKTSSPELKRKRSTSPDGPSPGGV